MNSASNSLRIAFAGTPQFALPALRALLASRHHVVGVLTQPDRPAGRGLELRASPIKLLAQEAGIPLAQPARLKSDEERAALISWKPELLVVVAYGLILPAPVLALPRLGCLNIHGSLLPRWRGAAPIQRALLAGDAETGVTIMQLDAGLDTGPTLLERRRSIGLHDTAGDLHDALAELGAGALLEAIDGLAAGTLAPRAQPTEGVSYAAKIDKSEARIDWRDDVLGIDRRIRAFNPWPIADTLFAGETLRVHRASVADARGSAAEPGTVLGLAEDGLRVACGTGVLALRELQRAGKRPVSARDFANAVSLAGLRFGS
jgi:methionyl-tRNA formyltransferase